MNLGYVFPGQGSQKVGMGKDLYEGSDYAKERFELANQTLGYNLSDIMFEGPMEELTKTLNAQPAIFLISSILIDLLNEQNVRPVMVAGHSLGELTAYYAAGVLDFESCLIIWNHL